MNVSVERFEREPCNDETQDVASLPRLIFAILFATSIKVTFAILQSGRVIYQDTANGMTYDFSEQPEVSNLYPLWIPNGNGSGELVVAFNNQPSKELARRFYIQDNRIVKIDTLPTFNGPAKNWDKDDKLEFAGYYDSGEEWDDEQGRHRMAYNPTLYYETGPMGLKLDSTLSTRKIKEDYGEFRGFKYSETPGIIAEKLPKTSRFRR